MFKGHFCFPPYFFTCGRASAGALVFQSVVPRPAASASPGNLQIQVLSPTQTYWIPKAGDWTQQRRWHPLKSEHNWAECTTGQSTIPGLYPALPSLWLQLRIEETALSMSSLAPSSFLYMFFLFFFLLIQSQLPTRYMQSNLFIHKKTS